MVGWSADMAAMRVTHCEGRKKRCRVLLCLHREMAVDYLQVNSN